MWLWSPGKWKAFIYVYRKDDAPDKSLVGKGHKDVNAIKNTISLTTIHNAGLAYQHPVGNLQMSTSLTGIPKHILAVGMHHSTEESGNHQNSLSAASAGMKSKKHQQKKVTPTKH